MTPEQSKTLKPGARVCWNGEESDQGTVKATNAKYVTIRWLDGHESFTGHGNMHRIELTAPEPAKRRN
jgi:hypothetical protein